MADASFSLQLAFDSNNPEFCRGFEAADVYRSALKFAEGEHPHTPDPGGDCGCAPDEFWETVHASNAEMMLRIAEACGLRVQATEIGNGWMDIRFKRESGGDKA